MTHVLDAPEYATGTDQYLELAAIVEYDEAGFDYESPNADTNADYQGYLAWTMKDA